MKPYLQIAVRKPIIVLIVWFLVIFGMVMMLSKLKANPTMKSMVMSDDPDREANEKAKEVFGNDEMIVVAVEDPRGVFNLPTLTYIDELTRAFEKIAGVREVYSLTRIDNIRGRDGMVIADDLITELPETEAEVAEIERAASENPTYTNIIISPDKKVASINIELALDHNDAKSQAAITQQVKDVLANAKTRPDEVKTHLTGFPVASFVSATIMNQDMGKFGFGGVLLVLVLVALVLRAWQGVAATLLVLIASITVTYGSMSIAGVEVTMPLSVVGTFLVALCMEYSLYVAFSYNARHHLETREAGSPPTDARKTILGGLLTVRGGLLLSAASTAIGFASLTTARMEDIKLMGVFLFIGTLVAGLGAATIVPAVLSLKPYRVRPQEKQNRRIQKIIDAIGELTVKRTAVVVSFMAVILGGSIFYCTRMSTDADAVGYFKEDSPFRKDVEFVRAHGGGTTFMFATVTADKVDAFKEVSNLQKLDEIATYAESLPHVTMALSVADYIKLINKALRSGNPEEFKLPKTKAAVQQYLLLHNQPDDFRLSADRDYQHANIMLRLDLSGADAMVGIEKDVEAFMKTKFPNYDVNVVGTSLLVHRAFTGMAEAVVTSLGTGVVLIFILMMIGFRSVKMGILSLLPNIAPAAAVYAVLPLIGRPLDMATAATGAIALGIAVDDTTHFLKTWVRKREKFAAADAVRETLSEIGQPMVLSSVVLAAGFSLMLLSGYGGVSLTGFMMVLVTASAFMWDLLFTPSMMYMVGKYQDAKKQGSTGGATASAT